MIIQTPVIYSHIMDDKKVRLVAIGVILILLPLVTVGVLYSSGVIGGGKVTPSLPEGPPDRKLERKIDGLYVKNKHDPLKGDKAKNFVNIALTMTNNPKETIVKVRQLEGGGITGKQQPEFNVPPGQQPVGGQH